MNRTFSGKTVLITGASQGIGLAAAEHFLKEGANVVGVSREPADMASTTSTNADHFLHISADLSLPGTPGTAVRQALQRFGGIDVLVNNAGAVAVRKGFLDATDEMWESTMELNFMGYVRMSREVLPHMLEAGSGSIIHVGSEAGRTPLVDAPDYSVSKAAILSLSKLLSREFGPKGIRSNVVAPAHIYTPMWDRPGGFLDSQARKFDVPREEAIQAFVEDSGLPVGRLGTADDVAPVILFLASPAAGFITGAEYTVNGGVTTFV
ncbi:MULTISPECIES: SDR family oxidoreductase [Micrococcaceae]|jgi:NAD(P)-dependent dehydrogenase (short-subunit alcohol dehydrogenase family)|uniref:Oxidoreductase, short chain dehydrogenase/reductase family n=1 Tax=Paenarthrobacter aurescens (strain TC1) TaxID=290340 RepID=A1R350_PAEAT|nr:MULTISPECIES: SDR family oxidoreductase [Micrococcaceae]ABM07210.1 oxidoreductase, short chain dehydrogenase/reductase family [Paenarthrobacter aurescens TC1]AFR27749.1 putative oxidoreductase [Arthrobacter sp. Rue61a]MBP2267348.1 NAD(P)-dependent dehydrogenase (short-subunit alcohol dehydrogenase family) [Pseudarthrobacter sp. PvP004]